MPQNNEVYYSYYAEHYLKRKLPCQYIGETKRKLNERFGEYRRFVENPLISAVLPLYQITLIYRDTLAAKDMQLLPLELISNSRDSVRKAREA